MWLTSFPTFNLSTTHTFVSIFRTSGHARHVRKALVAVAEADEHGRVDVDHELRQGR
jgi:hypothetical protein